ncbi:MAG TPA: hypothetical protein VFC11_01620 [Methylocella sp.]|nr:hypothetical protein [Methylocella sp.]
MLAPSPAQADKPPITNDSIPLPSQRDAEPYESLRAASDKYCHETGSRPKIFLVPLGEPQGFAAASAFATNFFAAAGLEALTYDSPATAQDAADNFRVSGCKIACICTAVTISTAVLIEAAARLSDAGAARIYLAGREPGQAATALLQAGVNELICTHRDALAILWESTLIALGERLSLKSVSRNKGITK